MPSSAYISLLLDLLGLEVVGEFDAGFAVGLA